ncbi:ribonuclease E domain-containing protein [Pontibacter burrus]|uniref:Uncharacterized protein n=1 Tax=Pontibacter burrus TaxID=2704466 RepID=A0A6B3LYU6_9BACT|nr:hypothetical protein [Pontibacter burrus]NEM98810.1 hypothetical protein [Pontibacter burrus]
MEPEEIDKLFNQRLGRMAPTPPADLWNRLQDRIQEEMPQAQPEPQHEQKSRFGFIYYSIAAAITLLLAVGVVLKFNQPQAISDQTIAQVDVIKQADQPTIAPETETIPEQTIAAATTPDETIAEPVVTPEPTIAAEPKAVVTKKPVTRNAKKTERWVKMEENVKQPAAMLAQQTPKPATTVEVPTVTTHTPASFASAGSAEPVQIIIKRTVNQDDVAYAAAEEAPEESTSFQRKQKLAKNIFKQVKNLSNGEKVNLEEVGLNADRIALETRIGKQKISKVINL